MKTFYPDKRMITDSMQEAVDAARVLSRFCSTVSPHDCQAHKCIFDNGRGCILQDDPCSWNLEDVEHRIEPQEDD